MSQQPETDRLAKVLGPEGPELTCEQCFEELDRYVEIELTDEGAGEQGAADAALPGMRAHLQGCPACAEDHASLLAYLRSTT
jgi:hypothetical protein